MLSSSSERDSKESRLSEVHVSTSALEISLAIDVIELTLLTLLAIFLKAVTLLMNAVQEIVLDLISFLLEVSASIAVFTALIEDFIEVREVIAVVNSSSDSCDGSETIIDNWS